MIRLHHTGGRFVFVVLDSEGVPLPIEGNVRAWRPIRFPSYWHVLMRGAA